MCLFFILLFFGPRIATIMWWLVYPLRFDLIFDTWILPVLGILFLPWTTLTYIVVGINGLTFFDWMWMILALIFDLASYATSGYSNRDRIPEF